MFWVIISDSILLMWRLQRQVFFYGYIFALLFAVWWNQTRGSNEGMVGFWIWLKLNKDSCCNYFQLRLLSRRVSRSILALIFIFFVTFTFNLDLQSHQIGQILIFLTFQGKQKTKTNPKITTHDVKSYKGPSVELQLFFSSSSKFISTCTWNVIANWSIAILHWVN